MDVVMVFVVAMATASDRKVTTVCRDYSVLIHPFSAVTCRIQSKLALYKKWLISFMHSLVSVWIQSCYYKLLTVSIVGLPISPTYYSIYVNIFKGYNSIYNM